MRQFLLLLIVIVLAFLCGALLSFPLFKILEHFTDIPFHKITVQLCSLFGLVFILLYLQLNNILNKSVAGFDLSSKLLKRELSAGFLSGIAIILMLSMFMWILGMLVLEPDLDLTISFITTVLLKAILSGIFVALIEETLYRGALLGGLAKTTGVITAVFFSSIIYSAVHFIKIPQVADNSAISWLTGLSILSDSFDSFADASIIDSFLALFAFGVLLSLIRLNKGNIIQCIGLHAGVVFAMKVIREFTDYAPGNNYEYLVNHDDHMLGYLTMAWLVFVIIGYYRFIFKYQREA